MATHQPQFDALEQTDVLTIEEVEVRTKMKHSRIYELIRLGEFPAPIRLGGSKWIKAEVEEYKQRKIEERDRERGGNKFVPRAQLLQCPPTGNRSTQLSAAEAVASAAATESTLRVLRPELCAALRTLKIDIPELYLDQNAWQVNILVMKTDRKPDQTPKDTLKLKRRRQ